MEERWDSWSNPWAIFIGILIMCGTVILVTWGNSSSMES